MPSARCGALKTRPADLTRIAVRRGGVFPEGEIARHIDGRFEIGAHGTREMPVWGKVLHSDLSGTREHQMAVRGTILVILDYIESVQAKVFDRMISERKRVAEAYRSEGRGRSAEIIGKMEMELQQIQSEAYRESQKIMGRADAKAAEIYAKAYQKNPEFYTFTKTMESYRQTIDEESWLLLSMDSDYARHLRSLKGRTPE